MVLEYDYINLHTCISEKKKNLVTNNEVYIHTDKKYTGSAEAK
jgi:hypothetical protein